jgi:hypothetical protein
VQSVAAAQSCKYKPTALCEHIACSLHIKSYRAVHYAAPKIEQVYVPVYDAVVVQELDPPQQLVHEVAVVRIRQGLRRLYDPVQV